MESHNRQAGWPNRTALARLSLLAVAALAGTGCSTTISNPVPAISSISPTHVQAGSAAFTLIVRGTNFVFGATVTWNGSSRQALFVSDGELDVSIGPSDIAAPGTVTIQVINPPPGGGGSNTVTLTIDPQPSNVPSITSIQPSGALVGSGGLTLTVSGRNFTPGSIVTWNGGNRTTTYVSSTQLTATIGSDDLQTPGVAQIAVLNPAPGGGLSNTVLFSINNPPPVVTSLSPNTALANSGGFTLTVNGTGFTCAQFSTSSSSGGSGSGSGSGGTGSSSSTPTCTQSASTVLWNGSPRTTTWVSSSQLSATIASSDLGAAGTVLVTVNNPSPGGGTSAPAIFQVIPGAAGEGLPMLADLSASGVQANAGIGHPGRSGPAIAGGGRFVAFSSVSQNLVPNLGNLVANVFVRDTCLGIASGCTPTTVLASVGNDGQPPDADCLEPSISSDGRFVVFTSAADNLVSGVSGGVPQIYLRDTCLGVTTACTPTTTLLSVAPDGVTPGNGPSGQPRLSPDGQFVVFVSSATNLVNGTSPTVPQIYLRNTCAGNLSGCTPATVLVSVATDGVSPANAASAAPSVASGGRYVAFASAATNLVSSPTGGVSQVFWRDLCTGATGCTPQTQLASVAADGITAGNGPSTEPALSADGRFVIFSSQATNLLAAPLPSGTPQQIYQRDFCVGASGCVPSTRLVSVAADGSSPANATAEHPQTDQSGRYVVFASTATNLVALPTGGVEQIFGRDTCATATGCTPRTALLSVAADGQTVGNAASSYPAITTQAHFTAFVTLANNLVSNDATPSLDDIILAVTTF
jgi:Tol biopolymer transport system component